MESQSHEVERHLNSREWVCQFEVTKKQTSVIFFFSFLVLALTSYATCHALLPTPQSRGHFSFEQKGAQGQNKGLVGRRKIVARQGEKESRGVWNLARLLLFPRFFLTTINKKTNTLFWCKTKKEEIERTTDRSLELYEASDILRYEEWTTTIQKYKTIFSVVKRTHSSRTRQRPFFLPVVIFFFALLEQWRLGVSGVDYEKKQLFLKRHQ